MDKIDILVATYNGEKYIREQIDSILNQTHTNFNLLISDDGSKDNTVSILREYEQKDKRVKVFVQEKNLGYIRNFEFLLKQVTCEYYMLSDQDDFWLPEKVEKSYAKLINENFDLVFSDLEVVNADLETVHPSFWKYLKIDKKVKYDDYRTQYLYNCATGCTIISKKKFLNLILPVPYKSEFMPHDYWIALVVAVNGRIGHLPEKLIKYRQHGNNQIGTEKTSHKFNKFEQVRDLFLRVKIEHFQDCVSRPEVFGEKFNKFNEECLAYFLDIKDKKNFNFKRLDVFHKLYKYDRVSYYLAQFVILNMPLLARGIFHIRYAILKLMGKRK